MKNPTGVCAGPSTFVIMCTVLDTITRGTFTNWSSSKGGLVRGNFIWSMVERTRSCLTEERAGDVIRLFKYQQQQHGHNSIIVLFFSCIMCFIASFHLIRTITLCDWYYDGSTERFKKETKNWVSESVGNFPQISNIWWIFMWNYVTFIFMPIKASSSSKNRGGKNWNNREKDFGLIFTTNKNFLTIRSIWE